MSNTNSWSFPNMIDATQNRVVLREDESSVVNRTRLLMLTETTELYNDPTFGVGLRRYIWQYNNSNNRAMMKDRIKNQIAINEPCVDSENITFIDNQLEDSDDQIQGAIDSNKVNMTVILPTTFGGNANLNLDDEIVRWLDSYYTDTDEAALK